MSKKMRMFIVLCVNQAILLESSAPSTSVQSTETLYFIGSFSRSYRIAESPQVAQADQLSLCCAVLSEQITYSAI